MFLLVPAHPGFPGQIPQSRKTVVCVCVPYGLEVIVPKKSDLLMLTYLINRAVYKIFKVSDKDAIHLIGHFLGLHDVEMLYKGRCRKFLDASGIVFTDGSFFISWLIFFLYCSVCLHLVS